MQLRPYQLEAVEAVYRHLRERDDHPCVVLPTGCHAVDHPILMYDGTSKAVQNVAVGDLLMGPDSRPRCVLALCRGEDDLYRIVPHRGEPFVVNGDHALALVCTNEADTDRREHGINESPAALREYLGAHSVQVKAEKPGAAGATVLLLDGCPANPAHGHISDTAVILRSDGTIGFECKHDGCQNVTWTDVRAKIDPEWAGAGQEEQRLLSHMSLLSQPWPEKMAEEAFYGLAGEIVRAIEPHTEADPVALLLDFLVSFGSAAGRYTHFVADGARHYPNFFCVLVGATSKGRKGTARAQNQRLFETADAVWANDCVQGGLSSGEGLIWAVRDPITKRERTKEKGGGCTTWRSCPILGSRTSGSWTWRASLPTSCTCCSATATTCPR